MSTTATVKTMVGTSVEVDVGEEGKKVSEVKKVVEKETTFAIEKQRLLLQGNELDDEVIVKPNQTLHLILRIHSNKTIEVEEPPSFQKPGPNSLYQRPLPNGWEQRFTADGK